jgi:two-component system chemotaxis response regulator CheB
MALKVLVVDDSALMRKHLSQLFTGAGFDVVLARDGLEAVDLVLAHEPDVVSLDINMPGMDGLTALSLIMAARPTPVVMVSSLTTKGASATLEALALGAVDYVAKPGGTISLTIDAIAEDLIRKTKVAAHAKVRTSNGTTGSRLAQRREPTKRESDNVHRQPVSRAAEPGLVLIGVSTGGPRTLEDILPQIPAEFPWPVLVAQHMPAAFTSTFASRLDNMCALRVREVAQPEVIEPGTVFLARGGTDMVVARRGDRLMALPKPESPSHLWHPSVTVLVESALAQLPAERLVAIQLTGMGFDGADAMARLHQSGGKTIAESEDSAVVFGMPKELIERGGASAVLPAPEIARQLTRWLM